MFSKIDKNGYLKLQGAQISWEINEENPELLEIRATEEHRFIHETKSRGSTNFLILTSSAANSGGGVVVTSGRNAKMPCRADGQPKPKVYWISPKQQKFEVGSSGKFRQG